MNECVNPSPRIPPKIFDDNRWFSQHTRQVHDCKEAEPDVLLIGDSIIQKMIYFEDFWSIVSSFHPLNLGIGGDRVQNVLWRIQNGSLSQILPKVIVLHVGTNNTADNNAANICEGIVKIVDELQQIFPTARVIFWALLPRGQYPNCLRTKCKEVNAILQKSFAENPRVEIIDSGNTLEQPEGTISEKDMYDFLHLTQQGYIKSFSPVIERLKEILNDIQ